MQKITEFNAFNQTDPKKPLYSSSMLAVKPVRRLDSLLGSPKAIGLPNISPIEKGLFEVNRSPEREALL